MWPPLTPKHAEKALMGRIHWACSKSCVSEPVAAKSTVLTTLGGASHGEEPYLCWQYMRKNWDHKTLRPHKTS